MRRVFGKYIPFSFSFRHSWEECPGTHASGWASKDDQLLERNGDIGGGDWHWYTA